MKGPDVATEQRRPLAALRLRLRAKQLEAGRLRVLLHHTRSPLDGEARSARLGKVEAEIELFRKQIVRIEPGRQEESSARGAPGQAGGYEGHAEESAPPWLRRK